MDAINRRRPDAEPLPPQLVTAEAARKLGQAQHLDEDAHHFVSLLAHLGFGAAMGVTYALVDRYLPQKITVAGALFGMAVYVGNYLGTIPAVGALPPATRFPKGRNVLLIVSHLVWGVATAHYVRCLRQSGR